jgi:hypothetical protein
MQKTPKSPKKTKLQKNKWFALCIHRVQEDPERVLNKKCFLQPIKRISCELVLYVSQIHTRSMYTYKHM